MKSWNTIDKIFAASVLLAAAVFGALSSARAFQGPGSGPGVGTGAIGVNGANNLSVGTTTPTADTKFLVVASSTSATEFSLRVLQPAQSPVFIVRNDGNIGVATSTPNAAVLTVQGNIYVSGQLLGASISANNVSQGLFGNGSGNFSFPLSLGINTSTNVNLPQALSVYGSGYFSNFITSPGAGASSERFGLNSVAAGSQSVAFGNNARANTTQSVAIGTNANAITGGGVHGQVVIGFNAIGSLDSVVIGPTAQASSTGASQMIAIGDSALVSVDSGIAIGGTAVSTGNTTGGGIAIGQGASQTGFAGIALGAGATALGSPSSDGPDIVIGASSVGGSTGQVLVGYNITTGANAIGATVIGDWAGASAGASSSVVLGYYSEASQPSAIAIGPYTSASATNAIVIGAGNNFNQLLTNTTANSLLIGQGTATTTIFANFANNRVGIATTTPSQALAVQGNLYVSGNVTCGGSCGGGGVNGSGTADTIAIWAAGGTTLGNSNLKQNNGAVYDTASGISVGTSTTAGVNNVLAMGQFLTGTITANQVTAGLFGAGSGNYSFPLSLGVNTSTNVSLPRELSVYGNALVTGGLIDMVGSNAYIGTTAGGITGGQNVGVGYQALQAGSATGSTAVGWQALKNDSGNNNTAVGWSSMNAAVTGIDNVALGYNSLGALTSANNDVGVGFGAGGALTTGGNNVGVGFNALQALVGGTQNVAIGAQSLTKASTTATTQNVAIGYQSMQNAVSGVNLDVAIGPGALQSDAGFDNIAIGSVAMANSANGGSDNVAIGSGALQNNNGGSTNVAIGKLSMNSNSGLDNNAIGFGSLLNNGGGSYNNAVGVSALGFNTSGGFNTAMGHSALANNATGNNNNAFGIQALYSSISGGENTAIGSYALYNASNTSAKNVVLGNYAGYNATNASSDIFIGYGAGYSELGSNKLYIENSSATIPLIYGDFAANRVGINTSSPAQALAVQGNLYVSGNVTCGGSCGGGGVTGSGTSGTIAMFAGGTTVLGNSNLKQTDAGSVYDTATGISVGTSSAAGANNILAMGQFLTGTIGAAQVQQGVFGGGSGNFAFPVNLGVNTSSQVGLSSVLTVYGNVEAFNMYASDTIVFIGSGAGNHSYAGSSVAANNDNIALGANALSGIGTNKVHNIAIGVNALSSSTGNYDIAIGGNAIGLNNFGFNNIAMGWNSLGHMSTGAGNIGIGTGAIQGMQTGSFNVVVGHQAGQNLEGGSNVLIGSSVLDATSSFTENYNVIIGAQAASNATSSMGNVMIGYSAGFNNISSTGNIFIGSGAGYYETGSKKLYIHDSSATIPLIYGDFATTRVGIATTTPSQALAVQGSLYVSGDVTCGGTCGSVSSLPANNVTAGLFGNGSGNFSFPLLLGINTSTNVSLPRELSVYGNALITGGLIDMVGTNAYIGTGAGGSTGANNVGVGYQTLKSGGGSSSVAIGYQALTNNSGNGNTAVGWTAMNAVVTGGSNSAVGYNSLGGVTSGANNVAVGYNAASTPTTGSANVVIGVGTMNSGAGTNINNSVAVGYQAMHSIASGILYDTAVGYQALSTENSGGTNTAVGGLTLQINSGLGNTVVGYDSMTQNTGNNNTVLGYASGGANNVGSNNIAIGINTLANNLGGSNNTAIGYKSMFNNSTGTDNIAIGYQSLYNASGSGITSNVVLGDFAGYNTQGAGNIFLGYGAGYNVTSSNLLIINNSSSSPPLIYGDFSTSRVGINTSTPTQALSVQGNLYVSGNVTCGGSCGGGGGVGGSGTTNYIPFWSAGTTLGNSIIYQSSTAILINGASSSVGYNLLVNGGIATESGGDFKTDSGQFFGGTDTAAAPAFSWAANANTGVYNISTNVIGVTTNGVERMRVNNSSSISVATTSSKYTLNIGGAATLGKLNELNFLAAANTNPINGDIWYDSTQNALSSYTDGINQVHPGVLFTQTADASVFNTNVATSILASGVGTTTLPANFFVPGKSVRITAKGRYHKPGASAGNVTIQIKLGATVILDTGASTLTSNNSGQTYEVNGIITDRTTGASGSVAAEGGALLGSTATANNYFSMNNAASPITIDTTAAQTIGITWQFGTASTTLSATSSIITIESLN